MVAEQVTTSRYGDGRIWAYAGGDLAVLTARNVYYWSANGAPFGVNKHEDRDC